MWSTDYRRQDPDIPPITLATALAEPPDIPPLDSNATLINFSGSGPKALDIELINPD